MKNVTDFRKTVEIGVNQRLFYSHMFIPQVTLFFEERGNPGNQNFGIQKCYCYGEKNQKNSHFGKT